MIYKILYALQELLRLLLLRCGVRRTALLPIKGLQSSYVNSLKAQRTSTRTPLTVLVVSQCAEGSTSLSRVKALRAIFGAAEVVPVEDFIRTQGVSHFVTNHLYAGARIRALNARVRDKASVLRPDLLWVDRGLYLWPETLQRLRAAGCAWMVHYSPDNHQAPGNQSRHYFQCVPLYDAHVTTKSDDVTWLKKIGARRVEHVGKAFDPELHRPLTLSASDRERYGCDVGFTGHWEPGREKLLLWLAEQGLRLKIWGGGWEHAHHKNALFENAPHLIGDDYAKAIQGAKIQLCLLSEWVRDRATARSVEIPACGTFLLAERTPAHQALFKEGEEAEFYSSRPELLEKIQRYLKNESARLAIARGGRLRCLAGYRSEDRLRELSQRLWPSAMGRVA